MIRFVLVISFVFLSYSVKSHEVITSITIKDSVVVFTTDKTKTHAMPNCIEAQYQQLWSASLDTSEGQAVFNQLLLAANLSKPITLNSAEDCEASLGIERVKAVMVNL